MNRICKIIFVKFKKKNSQFSGSDPFQRCVHGEDRAAQKALSPAEPKGKGESRQMEGTGSNLLRILPNYLNFEGFVN